MIPWLLYVCEAVLIDVGLRRYKHIVSLGPRQLVNVTPKYARDLYYKKETIYCILYFVQHIEAPSTSPFNSQSTQAFLSNLSTHFDGSNATMRFSIAIAALLVGITTAMPDPLPQGYTGPCSKNDCGATHKVCGSGYLCVPWPHTDPALRKGCTCSYG